MRSIFHPFFVSGVWLHLLDIDKFPSAPDASHHGMHPVSRFRGDFANIVNPAGVLAGHAEDFFCCFGADQKIAIRPGTSATQLLIFFLGHILSPFLNIRHYLDDLIFRMIPGVILPWVEF
jgi:hypothetical protein